MGDTVIREGGYRQAFPEDTSFAGRPQPPVVGYERLPEPRRTVPATYPPAASARGIEGVVLLNVHVDSLARANGHAVEAWTGVPMRFSLRR